MDIGWVGWVGHMVKILYATVLYIAIVLGTWGQNQCKYVALQVEQIPVINSTAEFWYW